MRIMTRDDSREWDEFVDQSPYGTIFHKWGFLETIEKHTGYTLLPYGMYQDEKLVCIFPAFLGTQFGAHVIFSPPPRTGIPYMGFVMSKEYDDLTQGSKEKLLKEVITDITGKFDAFSPIYTSVQIIPMFDDVREFKWSNYSIEPLFSYCLPTDIPLDEILKGFSRSTKRMIRGINANKFGMKMAEGTSIEPFYNLLSKRYEDQHVRLPLVSREYLEDLLQLYPDNIRLYYVYDENDAIIGANMVLFYKGKVISWMGTPRPDVSLPVNEFIFWELIKKSKESGSVFEIGGADTQHICSFKSRFNPSLKTSYRVFRRTNIGAVAEWAYLNLYKKVS